MLRLIIYLIVVLNFSSCILFRSNLMLRTPKDYQYDELNDSLSRLSYILSPNDIFVFRVHTNDGYKLIDLTIQNSIQGLYSIEAYIDQDGYAKLPLLGKVKIAGLTLREAEKKLEELYGEQYVRPFITMNVINKRVIVFPGLSGQAKVINIQNANTTVFEALAIAGGIVEDGKAYKVKLIRNTDFKKPKVYLMDLSTIEGLKFGNTFVQANDIIYVEPRYRPFRTALNEISPVISLISSVMLLLTSFYFLTR
ncbi:MAG: polysaccharide biosynthesis/export family protein [Bacteroidia bacterium]|nr:polysaccharide biosynthesis/export family protein [Bacteroidia bacterium]